MPNLPVASSGHGGWRDPANAHTDGGAGAVARGGLLEVDRPGGARDLIDGDPSTPPTPSSCSSRAAPDTRSAGTRLDGARFDGAMAPCRCCPRRPRSPKMPASATKAILVHSRTWEILVIPTIRSAPHGAERALCGRFGHRPSYRRLMIRSYATRSASAPEAWTCTGAPKGSSASTATFRGLSSTLAGSPTARAGALPSRRRPSA